MLGGFAEGAVFHLFAADEVNNLPFMDACAVLNDVLLQLSREGLFTCRSIFLEKLLAASKEKLPWNDFPLIQEGVERRNGVAHRGEILPRGDCWKYVDAIQAQFVAWSILEGS